VSEVSTMVPGGQPRIIRPARALLGWLPADQGERIQHGNRQGEAIPEESKERAARARAAVAVRNQGLDQTNAVSSAPPEIVEHIQALHSHSLSAQYFAEGWAVSLVDLSRICAAQPTVFVDHSEDRVKDVDVSDLRSVAAVSLPIPSNPSLPAQFDDSKNVWLFSAPNPNLRLMGNFAGEVQPGVFGYGFMVGISPSFIQVADFQGRLFLRDGYHRAVGFLKRGITTVPALTRTFGPLESLGLPAGMLPQGAYFGPRPPSLPDYLDDDVSHLVQLPAFQKMLVIQGLEVTPIG
jgi:hypothetical protein